MQRNVALATGAFLRRSLAGDVPLWQQQANNRLGLALASFRPHSYPHSRALSTCCIQPSPTSLAPYRQSSLQCTRPSITFDVASAWSRSTQIRFASSSKRNNSTGRRNKSSATDRAPKQPTNTTTPASSQQDPPAATNAAKDVTKGNIASSPPPSPSSSSSESSHPPPTPPPPGTNFLGQLPKSLPHLPHLPHLYRPTKAELLDAASGFWSRIRVHFKWLTIRSTRPFNVDEMYALISWILAAHFLWVVLGTTTFFMLTVFLINTVFAQETVAQWIGNYLTKSSGLKVVFESAVVPKWKDGVISFRNVYVSRRPGQKNSKVSKGSHTSAAAAAAAIAQKEKDLVSGVAEEEEEDTNYTQFDISIATVNVTLSFSKWFNGKGLLKDVEIKGIRGVVDRTSVHTVEGVDPRSYKHEHNPGDFELDSFKMEDVLVTIYQPDKFRPFSVSIYSCDLPKLRKQWLFYDFLSANMMSGSFDNSLFTIHPRQTHNYTGAQLTEGRETEDGSRWKKQSRIRIDGLNIDHLNRGYDGPFSWIYEGNVDIVADIMLPSDDDDSLAKVMSDMYDRVEATVTQTNTRHYSDHAAHGFDDHARAQHLAAEEENKKEDSEGNRFIIMDVRVHLNDVRAAVPLFTRDISYVNNALVRPIVAYINSKKTFIPVNCRVVKRVGEFDGSWTLYDSGLMEDVSREMYDAFARDVLDDNVARKRRIKKVGIWTLQLAAQALFLGLAGNIA